jgi:outer membrane receptor protein involved in Fe transport
MRLLRILIASATVLLAGTVTAAELSGIVVDAAGAPIPGATVTVSPVSGPARGLTTVDDGLFSLTDLSPGELTVQASAPGYTETVMRATTDRPVRLVLQPYSFVESVTVTAARGLENLATAASTTVLTSAELLLSPAGSLDDALRATPGFTLFRRSSSRVSNPTTQGVTLRGISGSGASRTMVLADGQPLNDPFGSWVYWNRVPQAAVARVEVVRGATGDLYGADALGGVVQVLTFEPGRTRVRATVDGGSHDTYRSSIFGGAELRGFHGTAAGEWVRTDGVITIAPEARGSVDVPADSDYNSGFVEGGYNAGNWRASGRFSAYTEDRGNGTPAQLNSTSWKQVSGAAAGAAAGGAWEARVAGGKQTFQQSFSAVAAGRGSERLTTEQRTPTTFSTFGGQWVRAWGSRELLVGAEGKHTNGIVNQVRYAFATGAPGAPTQFGGAESSGSGFARVGLTPLDALTVVAGARVDVWRSTPSDAMLAQHRATFFSPRVSAAYSLSDEVSLQASAYRAHRTPTLNELHRGFRVGNVITNPNPLLDPEHLSGFEGGLLFARNRTSARVTAFWNSLAGAITNVTLVTTPSLITRERQNTNTVRASGFELEVDVRPSQQWTFGGVVSVTRSRFSKAPAQPALQGLRTPQVPSYQIGGTATYLNRAFTGSVQVRLVGEQFDDDLNLFALRHFGVVDASFTQALRQGVQLFVAVENMLDAEYDVGRSRVRTVGWPRTLRVGARLFLPQ